jgi:predicted ferric reductase
MEMAAPQASYGPPLHASTRYGRAARTDAAVRDGAVAVLWLSLLLVTYWWVSDRGIQDLVAGWASGMTSLGRITGLVASVLLLAQVTLMARVPLLERAYGQDRITRLHRLVGLTSFSLMLTHIGTITWGYAGGGLLSAPAELWRLTVHYPGMLLAVAGTACLCMVVATSVKAARRRLRYESWHLLHLYAYLGVSLAVPHQLWTGQQFLGSPAKAVFWWTAWSAAAGAILVWRVGVPLCRNLRHSLRVAAVIPEADGHASVYVTGRRLDRLRAEPGQFLSWRFLGRPGWSRAHPYSLSAAPDGRSLRITVQAVGDGSADVFWARPGSRVLIEGPYGRLSARSRTREKVALIGAGVGITPLRALAEGLRYGPDQAVMLHRFTTQPLFAAELEHLARHRGLQLLHLPGRRRSDDSWLGSSVGSVSDAHALFYWVPDIAHRDVYVCGPERWTDLVIGSLRVLGVPSGQVHVERFSW